MDYVSVISIVLAFASALFSLFTYFHNIEIRKRERTINAYVELEKTVLWDLSRYTKESIKAIVDNPTGNKANYNSLSSILYRLTTFSICVNEGVYDYNLVNKMSKSLLTSSYYSLKPLIEKKKTYTKGHINVNYDPFVELSRRIINDRKNINKS